MKCDMQACNKHTTFFGKNSKFKQNSKWKPPNKSSQNKTFRKLNPKKFGKVMTCHNCGAMTHFEKECPEKDVTFIGDLSLQDYITDDDEQISVEKFSEQLDDKDSYFTQVYTSDVLIADVLVTQEGYKPSFGTPGKTILDTGCVRTVAGRKWMNEFLRSLSKKTQQNVNVEKSDKIFRFGGGEQRKSLGCKC